MQDGIVPNEGGNLWLIELLTPFNNEENNHQQQMLADLKLQNFMKEKIRMFSVDGVSGAKRVIEV